MLVAIILRVLIISFRKCKCGPVIDGKHCLFVQARSLRTRYSRERYLVRTDCIVIRYDLSFQLLKVFNSPISTELAELGFRGLLQNWIRGINFLLTVS